jgi:hypothetical protein
VIADVEVVRSPRARRARLSVDPASGRVRLTIPGRAALARYREWVEAHRDWIAAQQAKLPAPRPFAPGATITFGDTVLTIDWSETRSRVVRRIEDRLMCGGPAEGLTRRIDAWLKREAKQVLTDETAHYAALAGVTIDAVTIGDPRARWGSCTSSGRIRYSWRLILAPDHVRRSTVAHEVAHRVHMNHSAAFHAVADAIFEGSHAEARAWLRRHGAALHWIGREG